MAHRHATTRRGFRKIATLVALLVLGRIGLCAPQDEMGEVALGPQGRMVQGTVASNAADHLAVKTEDGALYQVMATTNTRIMKDRQPVKLADIRVGDGVGAVGNVDDATKTVHAVMLFVIDAAEIRKAREDLGKTFISGRIVAINMDDLRLTIKRPDNVTQRISVDEGTSFKRGTRRMSDEALGFGLASGSSSGGGGSKAGASAAQPEGESITLVDIHVGDRVFGTGGLKAGVFVPTQLFVMDVGAQRRRRSQPSAAGSK